MKILLRNIKKVCYLTLRNIIGVKANVFNNTLSSQEGAGSGIIQNAPYISIILLNNAKGK